VREAIRVPDLGEIAPGDLDLFGRGPAREPENPERAQVIDGQLGSRLFTTNQTFAGRSASRRMYQANQALP
jgi:hypothetical protein